MMTFKINFILNLIGTRENRQKQRAIDANNENTDTPQ